MWHMFQNMHTRLEAPTCSLWKSVRRASRGADCLLSSIPTGLHCPFERRGILRVPIISRTDRFLRAGFCQRIITLPASSRPPPLYHPTGSTSVLLPMHQHLRPTLTVCTRNHNSQSTEIACFIRCWRWHEVTLLKCRIAAMQMLLALQPCTILPSTKLHHYRGAQHAAIMSCTTHQTRNLQDQQPTTIVIPLQESRRRLSIMHSPGNPVINPIPH